MASGCFHEASCLRTHPCRCEYQQRVIFPSHECPCCSEIARSAHHSPIGRHVGRFPFWADRNEAAPNAVVRLSHSSRVSSQEWNCCVMGSRCVKLYQELSEFPKCLCHFPPPSAVSSCAFRTPASVEPVVRQKGRNTGTRQTREGCGREVPEELGGRQRGAGGPWGYRRGRAPGRTECGVQTRSHGTPGLSGSAHVQAEKVAPALPKAAANARPPRAPCGPVSRLGRLSRSGLPPFRR